mmetsp:Transcript_8459/g.11425  ORF Transcript_8459/g.11425 Transcript_8459/m.11425 type:complete len:194 (+) Transcript_8459:358-939(+)
MPPWAFRVGGGASRVRWEVVARLGGLEALNGSPVTRPERRDAEIRYLRRLLDESREQEGEGEGCGREAVAQEHPRFTSLLQQYGELAAGSAASGTVGGGEVGSLGQELLSVTLRCVAASAGEKKEVMKKLPGSLSVDKLKLLCENIFKLNAETQELFTQYPDSPIPQPLGEDREQLSHLGIQDGVVILVGARE